MVDNAGFELPTSRLVGCRDPDSPQATSGRLLWWSCLDSNQGPLRCERSILTAELHDQKYAHYISRKTINQQLFRLTLTC